MIFMKLKMLIIISGPQTFRAKDAVSLTYSPYSTAKLTAILSLASLRAC